MLTLPAACTTAILAFAPLFSKRVFGYAQTLIVGAILAPAQRTVTACLRVMGLADEQHFQNYHRVLNRARWSALKASRILLGQVIDRLLPSGPVIVGLDDTLERRRGKKIRAKGIYRDAVRSSHGHFAKATGLRWLSLMLLTDVRFSRRRWALPIMTILAPSERYHQECGRRHKKLTDWARQAILQLHRWLPDRQIIVLADSSFAALELLAAVRSAATMITRLRLDAALYEPVAERSAGQIGRPRRRGKRLPKLADLLLDEQQQWQRVVVSRWYGQDHRTVEVLTGTAVWSNAGKPTVPIRWVLVRDPEGKFGTQAFLSTDLALAAEQILSMYVDRWQMEVTFQEARQHLGVETQRQWSDQAIARTTPVVFALYSMVTLLADELHDRSALIRRSAAWYVKEQYCFSDVIASVRHHIWCNETFVRSSAHPDLMKVPRAFFEHCISTLCYAS